MQFIKMEEDLKCLIGDVDANAIMENIREEAKNTHKLLDIYYRILPNDKIYFFKRFLNEEEKITIERIKGDKIYEVKKRICI